LLNQQWVERGLEPWQHVIVLSAGTVICGNIGSPERLDYTVIGDAVNRASRLEAVAKQTGSTIVASEAVVERAKASAQAYLLGEFPLRGQQVQPVYAINADTQM
jgi:adenylate cyclase